MTRYISATNLTQHKTQMIQFSSFLKQILSRTKIERFNLRGRKFQTKSYLKYCTVNGNILTYPFKSSSLYSNTISENQNGNFVQIALSNFNQNFLYCMVSIILGPHAIRQSLIHLSLTEHNRIFNSFRRNSFQVDDIIYQQNKSHKISLRIFFN